MRFKIQVLEPSILMQTSSDPISLSSFSWWKHSAAKTMEQRWRRWLGGEKREKEDQGRRGTGLLLTRAYRTCSVAIPDTSGIYGLAVFVPKIILLIPKPLLCHYLVQKDIQSCSKLSIVISLIQRHDLMFSFPNIWHIYDFEYLRET